jgi:hypothetical protein
LYSVGSIDPVRRVRAAVEHDRVLDGRDRAVVLHADREVDVLLVASAEMQVHLFTRVLHGHGATGQLREDRGAEIQRRRLGLRAEAAADRRADDADVPHRDAKHARERAVQVVRRLRRRPEREALAMVFPSRQRGVRLHR